MADAGSPGIEKGDLQGAFFAFVQCRAELFLLLSRVNEVHERIASTKISLYALLTLLAMSAAGGSWLGGRSIQATQLADAATAVAAKGGEVVLDSETQKNAALVPRSAVAAASLREQADWLVQSVDAFRLQAV